MQKRQRWYGRSLICAMVGVCFATASSAGAAVLDFEADDFGTPLVNGQVISTLADRQDALGNPDSVFEFGNLVNISTTLGHGTHVGAAIFDSTPGENVDDPDLQVDLGNILILQDNQNPATTSGVNGLVFTQPDDEAHAIGALETPSSIVFDFLSPVELLSIDLVDIDANVEITVTLTDADSKTRTYNVPQKWTFDISTSGIPVTAKGYDKLDLTSLIGQDGEGFGANGTEEVVVGTDDFTTVTQQAGFNSLQVVKLDVAFGGSSPSGGLDNLVFIPEPTMLTLFGLSAIILCRRKK